MLIVLLFIIFIIRLIADIEMYGVYPINDRQNGLSFFEHKHEVRGGGREECILPGLISSKLVYTYQ